MDATILSSLIVHLQIICVIVVAAYLLTCRRLFSEVPDSHPAIKTHIILRSRTRVVKDDMSKILKSIQAFCGDPPPSDDITPMAIRVVV